MALSIVMQSLALTCDDSKSVNYEGFPMDLKVDCA